MNAQLSRRRRAIVASSLLGLGFRTAGARIAREHRDADPETWPRIVAERLFSDARQRHAMLAAAFKDADAALEAARRLGYGVLTCLDPDYPALLGQIIDPPLVLWARGETAHLSAAGVAIVGSRNALPSSLLAAGELANGLAVARLVVTSGFAEGVDTAAHCGALEAGGWTIAVLGCGLDVRYPRSSAALKERIASGGGALISEFPPGTEPIGRHFPIRNRIISGLSRATVIVEAGLKSGSLHTAHAALEQGREVLAMPGPVAAGKHQGCHALIKDGAPLVETVEDIVRAIGWTPPVLPPSPAGSLQLGNVEASMARGEAVTVDDLAGMTGQSASVVMAELVELELSGRVLRTATGGFIRKARGEPAGSR